ncbi:MAG TPA: lipid-binding SYLF domain-containing protein [Blastocatellia bacterium]|nr:lipid-binding SYLF domain-containing protein [Blastocatellia bacterium]
MNRRVSIFAGAVILALIAVTVVLPSPAVRKDELKDAEERADHASRVFQDVMNTPDKGIPQDLLDSANCIAVFPSVIKAAFIFGGEGGKGIVSCRDTATGAWGQPIFLKIGAGSVGFQIGGEATDLVLVGMNRDSEKVFTKDRFELGGDASVAAGPVGRNASARTDLPTISSEFLSYSRSRGAFAGISLQGSVIKRDHKLDEAVYGPQVSASEVMNAGRKAPASVAVFQDTLAKYSPRYIERHK